MAKHTCPSSRLPYQGRCPVTSCPFNFEDGVEEDNCLQQINEREDLVISVAAAQMRSQKDVRKELEQQTDTLIGMAKDITKLMEEHSRVSCPKCGYLRPCVSATVCNSRRMVCEQIETLIGSTLTKSQIWHLLVNNPTVFTKRKLDMQARQLIARQDLEIQAVNKP